MEENINTLFIKYIEALRKDEDFKRKTNEIEDKLKNTLNHEELVLFNDYTDAWFEYSWESSTENFKKGFWIGCEMMRELSNL